MEAAAAYMQPETSYVPFEEVAPMPPSLWCLASALRCGELDVTDYIDVVCNRIDALEPYVQALIEEPARRERLYSEASQLMAAFPNPGRRPPLYGVPVAVKDNIAVTGFPTRAGSQFPPDLFNTEQGMAMHRLREAGALIIGKSAMDEFCYCEPPPTRNPVNLHHTPGGSSNGSAAAVAAGYCPLAIGTQTLRDIILPASYCGVVGFKPTFGRVPSDGQVYLAPSLDTIGCFTPDIHGMLLAASVSCNDWPVFQWPERPPLLGIPGGNYLSFASEEVRRIFEDQVAALEEAGLTIRNVPLMGDQQLEEAYDVALELMHGEMATVHEPGFFAQHYTWYRPRTAEAIQQGQKVMPAQLSIYRTGQQYFRGEIERKMSTTGVEVWLSPACLTPPAASLDVSGSGGMNIPWSYAGMPCVTLPLATTSNGLPLGLQLIGRCGTDDKLLAWAMGIYDLLRGAQVG
jgi:Asp-tRNA(Asn)/Glu-tRNA(Gln) amidotransferase A subunit family amidase